ncbi:hypothetical protein MATR_14680 [Marivirga tractuosa]|uniref:Hemagluttinin repeat-containing protein n=1 Tax=Marivirga tractuosa (strain ATCC 23168 / DSM 4126 / NBRC 15989 / NCIMB 1408 / VKM B-1430 / H-43) TaxID=643867 RepID=E4TT58_MARTH|nr:T9SS type A sorting domain-containing protein [Marivirga tractuosa]ADR20906.1 hemagluttinin repeat-containing protein [Marivirga tractuosa DSM 4126]BDD14643.1 hypothetical protein MATR_14680 [Marivirga tractuosa]
MKRFLLSILFFVGVASVGIGQATGDFQTRQTGNWNNSDTWEEWTGSSWDNTANTPTSANGVISILNTHTVTVTAAVTVDQATVNNGGQITIASGIALTINDGSGDDITVNNGGVLRNLGTFRTGSGGKGGAAGQARFLGIFENQGSVTNFSSANLFFDSGSVYDHQFTTTEGVVPSASWDLNSTVKVTGYTSLTILSSTGNWGQSFGNFEWNTPNLTAGGQGWFDMDGYVTTANGDFNVYNTGGIILYITDFNQSLTLNVGGNVNLDGANTYVACTFSGNPMTWNVSGNFNITNSALLESTDSQPVNINVVGDFNVNTSSNGVNLSIGSSGTTVDLDGDLNIIAGSITETGTGTNSIIFGGGGLQNFTNTGGDFSNSINFSINNSSTLDVSTYFLTGSGTFEIGPGSTLVTANSEGITSGTTTGSIRVSGTRTFNTGSTIEYNGTATQALGNGFPASGVNLTINNTGGGVNMSSDVTISSGRTLTLTAGTLNIGDGNLLTLNGTVSTTSGGISGGSLSNLTIGGTGAFGTLGFVGTQELNDFTINRTSSGSVTLGGDLTINGSLTQTNGDLLLNGNSLTISGDYTQSAGSLISNVSSSLIVNGAGTLPTSLSFSGDINTITVDRASATLNTAASNFTATNLNLYSGTLDGTAISIANGGTLERRTNGSLTNALTAVGNYNLIYDNSSAINTSVELPTSATAINNIEKRGTGILTVQNDFTVNGILTFSNGTFNAGANTISLNGDLVANAGSTLNNSTITFDGTTNLTGENNPTFGSITVNGTFNPAASLTVNGDITNNGTLSSSAGTLTINATSQLGGSEPITVNDFTIGGSGVVTADADDAFQINGNITNNGSFDANGGTVIFGGITSISGTVPTFANVQIEGTLNSPNSLTASGNFINNGSFVNNGGTLNLNGSGSRNIGGSSALALNTLNVSGGTVNNTNTAGITIADGITIGANTTFDVDGAGSNQLILLSTSSSQAAYVGQIPSTSSISGNITVERYFSTGRFWRYLGSPVTNATVADWQEEFPITGTFDDPSSGTYDGSTLNSSNPSLYYYDAANSTYVAYPSSGTAASNSIENGRGYSPFIRNSSSNIVGAVTGTLQQQSASMPVEYNGDPAESWNLVANPYAAPIDWDAAGWTKTNVANEVHVPKTDGSFATYIGGTASNGGSQYIASGQAFWVRTDATSPVLETDESVKSVGQDPTYQRTAPLELFRIEMAHNDLSDEIVLVLRDEATFGYDEEFDASRRLNINGFGYTLSTTGDDGRNLKINSIPKVVNSDCSISIPVNMESVSKTGDFTLAFSQVNNLLNYYTVDFIDNYENEIISVDSDFQYTYTINSDAESKAKTRFSLLLNNKGIGALSNLTSIETCASSEASYLLEDLNKNHSYSIYKGDVKLSEVSNQLQATISIADSLLQDVTNAFDVYGMAGTCDSVKVGTFTVKTVGSNINLDANVIGSNICPEATSGNFELNTENSVDYYILAGNDTIQTIKGDGTIFTGTIESTYLKAGLNTFSIYAEKNECAYGSLNKQIEIEVDDLDIDQNITFSSNNSCLKTPADISFISQSGVEYQIFKENTLVTSVIGDGTAQAVEIPETNLSLGSNEFTVIAKYGECTQYEFPESVKIEVEENINANLSLITENVCGDANTSIVIENAQSGKVYTLQLAGENISSLTAELDGELEFNVNSNQLGQGLNELDIQIEGGNCEPVLSSNQAIINVYEQINTDLEVKSSNECAAELIKVEISNPQKGKEYRLKEAENVIATATADDESVLKFSLPSDQFGVGNHTLTIDIIDDNCGVRTANQIVEFELFEAATIAEIGNQNVCKGEAVSIDLSSNVAMNSYQLFIGEELHAETSSAILELAPTETTTYSLTGVPENGCGTNTVNFTIEVTDLATPGILVSNNVLESSVEGEGYQWYLNNEILPDETGKILVAQESGDYTVEVSKANCIKTSDAYTFSEEVLNANKALANAIDLYPNPVDDILNIDIKDIGEIEVMIYTLSGRFMDQVKLDSRNGQSIDMSKFAKGTYLLQLTSGQGSVTKRIIKK